LAAVVLYLVPGLRTGLAQAPTTLLEMQIQNVVSYWDDVADPSKLASSPNIAAPATRNFMRWIAIGDIVSVNGKPVKGTEVFRGEAVTLTPKPNPGQAIADTVRGNIDDLRFEIQQTDGIPIGTIMAIGLNGGSAPSGAPAASSAGNHAIVGGTGAFLGVRGQVEGAASGARQASMTEDPAKPEDEWRKCNHRLHPSLDPDVSPGHHIYTRRTSGGSFQRFQLGDCESPR
jgi:hypothetical protein